jgi:hypothetical protein
VQISESRQLPVVPCNVSLRSFVALQQFSAQQMSGLGIGVGLEGPILSFHIKQVLGSAVASAAVHATYEPELRRVDVKFSEIFERGGPHMRINNLA